MTTSISAALEQGLTSVTKKWCKQRKAEERRSSAHENRRYAMTRSYRVTQREIAFEVMEKAYLKASSEGTLPAHARQIMYAARGEILAKADADTLNDQYFTQTLLPDFMHEHPTMTGGWDVVYDARGHFREPHASDNNKDVPLGTIGVRDYLRRVSSHEVTSPDFGVVDGFRYPTFGPTNRFSAVLFVEKEGFFPLFDATGLADRYDIAIMSTKGMSNTASRMLIDGLSSGDSLPVYVLHDFDCDGFGIFGTLKNSTRRYIYNHHVHVVDFGLRLEDVKSCSLESEPASRRISADKLREYGATEKEIEFLSHERVELNAFTSADLIEWIEGKLQEHGVEKVIPDEETLANAYRRAIEVNRVHQAITEASNAARSHAGEAEVPSDLREQIENCLAEDPSRSWDDVVAALVTDPAIGDAESSGENG